MILLVVKSLLEVRGLLNIVIDLELEFLGDKVLVSQFLEYLKLFIPLVVLGTDTSDDGSHAVDVVSHYNAAECLNKDQACCLAAVGRNNVSEPYCKHDINCPIVRPNVPFEPTCALNALKCHPVIGRVGFGNGS